MYKQRPAYSNDYELHFKGFVKPNTIALCVTYPCFEKLKESSLMPLLCNKHPDVYDLSILTDKSVILWYLDDDELHRCELLIPFARKADPLEILLMPYTKDTQNETHTSR